MYRKIVHPFLLLIANSHESQWYKVTGSNRMEELATIIEEKAHFSDKEGHSRAGGASGSSLKTNEEWDQETQKHFKNTAEKTKELWNSGEYRDITVAAPENVKNQLMNALNLPKEKSHYMPGNFTHANLHHKLLEQIHESEE